MSWDRWSESFKCEQYSYVAKIQQLVTVATVCFQVKQMAARHMLSDLMDIYHLTVLATN